MLDIYIYILLNISYVKMTWHQSGMAMDCSGAIQSTCQCRFPDVSTGQMPQKNDPLVCRRTSRVQGALKE